MNTKKTLLFFIPLIFVLFSGGCAEQSSVCFENKCFDVEIVDTPETRKTGLMYRTSLPEEEGMLFIFENESLYPFWMKNTLIPLDIIWLDSDGKVVFIYENAQPCGEYECIPISPEKNSLYVLEINAGLTEKYKIVLEMQTEIIK